MSTPVSTSTPSNAPEKIRESVSAAYAKAVSTPDGGCCRGANAPSCGPLPEQKGVAVKTAGYRTDELAALPEDAVVNSFGCGNPLAFAEVREGETVVDLGSGAGIDLLIAAKKVGPTGRVIGIDMTDEMISRAQANIAAAGVDSFVEVRRGFIEELPVESNSVDWVISNCVINLSPEKDRVFAEIARVLRPGGRFSISDIVVKSMPEELRRDDRVYASCLGGAISEEEYLDGLRRAGLSSAEVTSRYIYDAAQLVGIVESELPEGAAGTCCCGNDPELLARLIASLEGNVWSARFGGLK